MHNIVVGGGGGDAIIIAVAVAVAVEVGGLVRTTGDGTDRDAGWTNPSAPQRRRQQETMMVLFLVTLLVLFDRLLALLPGTNGSTLDAMVKSNRSQNY
jgi:hypothetical protein